MRLTNLKKPFYRPRVEPLEDRCLLAPYNIGDVFVGLDARVNHYDSQGNFIESIPAAPGPATGMAFDSSDTNGNLYVTNFFGASVQKFDKNLNLVGTFGSGYTANPESIIFDTSGNAYVGQADITGTGVLLKFNPAGNLLASFDVAVENRGTDWIQLAPDQTTIYYTSEGQRVLRYDTATRTQLPDFVSNLPGSFAYALRLLPGLCGAPGGLLVADSEQIHLLDPSGNIVRSYDSGNNDQWFAININPDAKTFWSGDIVSGEVVKFDIATGQVLDQFTAGTSFFDSPSGIAVAGEISNPVPPPVIQEVVTYYATGAGPGGAPQVKVFNSRNNKLVFDFLAYDASFTGGVRVATGDVNGDGFPDIITAPGPGGGPNVRVFSGKDASLLMNFFAFDSRLTTGLYVAASDTDGDAKAGIIVAPDRGGGPNVRVFDGATGAMVRNFFAFNPRFTGGVRVAGGDVSHDGFGDVVAAAGPGGGPNVVVVDGRTGQVLHNFMAYNPAFTGGVFVATGRFAELEDVRCRPHDIITGAGPGGGNNVSVFDGETGALLKNFLAPPQSFISGTDSLVPVPLTGTRVSSLDHNGTKLDNIMVAYGEGANAVVNIFDFNTTQRLDYFFAYNPLFLGGVFIGSGH